MAHINKFLITFGFLLFGLTVWFKWPNLWGTLVFLALGITGAIISNIVFKKQATKQQIKEDLENRLKND